VSLFRESGAGSEDPDSIGGKQRGGKWGKGGNVDEKMSRKRNPKGSGGGLNAGTEGGGRALSGQE